MRRHDSARKSEEEKEEQEQEESTFIELIDGLMLYCLICNQILLTLYCLICDQIIFAIMDVCYAEAAQTILGAFYELGLVRSLTRPNQT